MTQRMRGLVRGRAAGTALTETLIIIPIFLMLALGVIQWSLIYEAKSTLNYATLMAARAGAVDRAKPSALRQGLAKGMVPLYSPNRSTAGLVTGIAQAGVDLGLYSRIRILNPTKQAFQDFGVTPSSGGKRELPNELLHVKSPRVGANSGVNIQDANLLKIEVLYGYDLKVPFVNKVITTITSWFTTEPVKLLYLRQSRLPILSTATVRMQSAAQENDLMVTRTQLDDAMKAATQGSTQLPWTLTKRPWETRPTGTDKPLVVPPGTGIAPITVSGTYPGISGGGGSSTGSGTGGNASGNTGNQTQAGGGSAQVNCETTWQDARYQAQKCEGRWYCFATNFTEQLKAAANVVWDFVEGVVAGIGDQVQDLWNLLKDPSVLLDLAKAFIDDAKGTLQAIVQGLGEEVQKVLECGPKDIGRVIGNNINPAAPVKIISKLASVTGNRRLTQYADDLARRTGCASFPAGTPISTPSGMVPIEQLSVGAWVDSRSEESLGNSRQKITALHKRIAPGVHRIQTEFGVIEATAEHPFWVQGRGWVEAKDIEWEDPIATRSGDVVAYQNDYIEKTTKVYNFTVEDTHSYFASDDGVWVHNANCETRFETSGKNGELNSPKPNTVYYVDGRHKYVTDAQGRTTSVTTKIQEKDLDTGIRDCYRQQQVGKCGLPDDEGGHLVATRLGGPGEKINLVPQNMNLNRGEWKKMENEWARRAANGETIDVQIEIVYSGNSARPDKFIVHEVYNGVPQTPREFINQAGG